MTAVSRVLAGEPVASLDDHVGRGGGRGLDAARRLGTDGVVEHLEASGLRGRGGAGFPTGLKWRTVAGNTTPSVPATVVVNGAEGEPGSFKDRAIIRHDPYRVVEGALIAATTVAATDVVLALKRTFRPEAQRLRRAVSEIEAAGWAEGIRVTVVEGPEEYLFGEETGLLEVLEGRLPFPRVAPPFRHGLDGAEPGTSGAQTAEVEMAGPDAATDAPPTLVNNVETMANVGQILAEGPDWFRQVGTPESPGTIVCTVTGRTERHGVAEFAMGTPLSEVISTVGGGPDPGDRILAVMSGVANPLLPGTALDAPVSYEGMTAAGTGLGAAGFIVFDDTTDIVAVAHGVSRFLAVESCGQCVPCKQDGLVIADLLDQLRRSELDEPGVTFVEDRLATVIVGARCYLAQQHQLVIESVLRLFPDVVKAHATGSAGPAEPHWILPIADLADGRAVLEEHQAGKQADWSYDEEYSGQSPADRFDQQAG